MKLVVVRSKGWFHLEPESGYLMPVIESAGQTLPIHDFKFDTRGAAACFGQSKLNAQIVGHESFMESMNSSFGVKSRRRF